MRRSEPLRCSEVFTASVPPWSWPTSAPADELAVLREVLDAEDAIDGQTTADEVASSKPEPEVFTVALETSSSDPRQALAIGDSVWDIEAARAAGIGVGGEGEASVRWSSEAVEGMADGRAWWQRLYAGMGLGDLPASGEE